MVAKIKVKNSVTVSQEKVLQDTSEKLQSVEKELQSSQQQLITKEEQVRPKLLHPVHPSESRPTLKMGFEYFPP